MTGEAFITAIAALYGASDDDDLCAPLLLALPVTGAAVSTLTDPFGAETICASDETAARLDELQIDLGEGPCWEALRTGRPVLEPDVEGTASERWPVALMAMHETRPGAVFAFPMLVGALRVGSVSLYNRGAGPLADATVEDATMLTAVVARHVLQRALHRAERGGDGADWHGSHYSRREVLQASGVMAAQTGVGADEALLLLRAYAFASGRTVRALAIDVLAGTIDFTDRRDTAL
ncbi:GAF and ANTAR domain-containing protein [Curtobacterium flaccumfaciens]|uniref:GAF and ANTAR domain-containing protein n=1 Tax=Curtobacterium flaccumfaciens TaxID=2035 RepID=UPI001BDEBD71|nr:GAF and ANTAR domain-containing protein [Curtobacterium flaccumfaciens]MBT1631527.1 GAF and ANTAR domain-containing protein [Curtobacterium flaccumfaciens pv. oortii]MCX2846835.1 GAF and ANTAR domain-containing protein [Curtobacterium flaccumfaciens pv. oortii]